MAPHHSCFALGAAVAVVLQGCGTDLSKHMTSMVGVLCKTACENMVNEAEEKYNQIVIEKCKELKDLAHEHVLSGSKSDALHDRCLDKAGAKMNEEAEEQQANYTEQCITTITNSSLGGTELIAKIQEFLTQSGFSGDLEGTLGTHLDDEIDNLKDEIPAGDDDSSEEEGAGSGDRLRLFASGARIPTIATSYGALSCLLGGALAAAVGLTAVLRRRATGQREPSHESLVDAEAAEESENAEM